MRLVYATIAIVIVIAAAIIIAVSSYGNKSHDCTTVTDSAERNDCYHALAHETFNVSFCSYISDNETMEHCLSHVGR